jgi:hypothetical protein
MHGTYLVSLVPLGVGLLPILGSGGIVFHPAK